METKNYIIRESVFSDYEYFARWEVDPGVTAFLSYNEDRTYEDVVSEAFANKADDTKVDYTIVDKQTAEPVGRIFISRIDNYSDSLDITKIYIGESSKRGKGIGREVLEGFLFYCFRVLKLERVTLDYYTGNDVAAELYRKLGFKDEGLARKACKKNGEYHDLNLMSILREEFVDIYGN